MKEKEAALPLILKCEAKEKQSQESGKRMGSLLVREKVTCLWRAHFVFCMC